MGHVQVRFCRKSNRKGSRYPFLAKNGSPNPRCSQFPVERPSKTEVGRLRTGFNELKGKPESGLSDNCTRLSSVTLQR